MTTPTLLPFRGVIQNYAWGGTSYLAELLGLDNSAEAPMAELWLGTHAKGPGKLVGSEETLDEYIAQAPADVLGPSVNERFGRLPFLLKILDVREMLSIQVHPTKEAAEIGFAREEENGPDRNAANRNYRDDNHKPELAVALTDFYLLHGFRPEAEIRQTLGTVPGWDSLGKIMDAGGVKNLYRHVMEVEQDRVNQLLQPLVDHLENASAYTREQPEFWARRAIEQYSNGDQHDRGMFSILWFNLVHLRPGEGIFQDAGVPHSYLEGVCVELMANGDNVLRGGLTPKHIDVPELLDKIRFAAVAPQRLLPTGQPGDWHRYPTPAPDFQLFTAQVFKGGVVDIDTTAGPAILLLLRGELTRVGSDVKLNEQNRAVFVPAGHRFTLRANAQTVVYRATVG